MRWIGAREGGYYEPEQSAPLRDARELASQDMTGGVAQAGALFMIASALHWYNLNVNPAL